MATDASEMTAQQQFEQLFERSRLRAYHLAYRLTGNAAEAEDLTQDAYLRAWTNFAHFNASHSFESWLFRIIANRAIDLRRQRKRVRLYSLDTFFQEEEDRQSLIPQLVAPTSDPEQIVLDAISDEQLRSQIAALPSYYSVPLLLCTLEECSYEEIAERLHCALGTVRSRIHRARGLLREQLKPTSRR